jgi:hypothetical protein
MSGPRFASVPVPMNESPDMGSRPSPETHQGPGRAANTRLSIASSSSTLRSVVRAMMAHSSWRGTSRLLPGTTDGWSTGSQWQTTQPRLPFAVGCPVPRRIVDDPCGASRLALIVLSAGGFAAALDQPKMVLCIRARLVAAKFGESETSARRGRSHSLIIPRRGARERQIATAAPSLLDDREWHFPFSSHRAFAVDLRGVLATLLSRGWYRRRGTPV